MFSAAPSPAREEIVPALEQVWGGKAYSAGRNKGEGLASPTVIGRGVPEAVSYAENTFAVYIMAEHGFYGALVVLLLYALLTAAVLPILVTSTTSPVVPGSRDTTAVAITVGGVLAVSLPALYVAASNVGVVPLTGQNMPILGLNAWSDVLFSSAIVSAVLAILVSDRAGVRYD
jgi:cell division protein FtsW (lipid II flippase)